MARKGYKTISLIKSDVKLLDDLKFMLGTKTYANTIRFVLNWAYDEKEKLKKGK